MSLQSYLLSYTTTTNVCINFMAIKKHDIMHESSTLSYEPNNQMIFFSKFDATAFWFNDDDAVNVLCSIKIMSILRNKKHLMPIYVP